MPFKTFTAGEVLTAANVNDYLMEQSVISCTSGTRPSSPNEGMLIYQTDTDSYMTWDGAAWRLGFARDHFARLGGDHNLTSNSTTFQDITGLTVTPHISATYYVKTLFRYSAGATSDIKFGFTYPAGATLDYHTINLTAAATTDLEVSLSFSTVEAASGGVSTIIGGRGLGSFRAAFAEGILIMSTTAGVFQPQAAQSVGVAEVCVVKQSSFVMLQRMI